MFYISTTTMLVEQDQFSMHYGQVFERLDATMNQENPLVHRKHDLYVFYVVALHLDLHFYVHTSAHHCWSVRSV